jgi:hypothetical protein
VQLQLSAAKSSPKSATAKSATAKSATAKSATVKSATAKSATARKKSATAKSATVKSATLKNSPKSAPKSASARTKSILAVAEEVKESLEIAPSIVLSSPVKTDYKILEYEGEKVPDLKVKVPGPPLKKLNFTAMRDYIKTNFSKEFTWPAIKVENKCLSGGSGSGSKAPKDNIIALNPTQNFVAHFFTPASPYKGLLLFHSVGTGKTCTAIATATASFDREDYTILWVTRTTLKSDIWKNMFDQICHSIIAEEVRNGRLMPADETKRKRLLSKNWIEPMSYKQFSNLLSGQNEFYQKLKQRNGADDVIKRTLIIIDEAHKLYGDDLPPLERPDMNVMSELLQKSYTVSGPDSARLLLMTATPFTNSPMEMFSLINMCIEDPNQKMITDPALFKERYMGQDNMLTESGVKKIADALSGYISYINREQDATQFAQPVMIEVPVIMSHLTGEDASVRPYLSGDGKEITKQTKQLKDDMKAIQERFKAQLKQKLATCKSKDKVGGMSLSPSSRKRKINRSDSKSVKSTRKINTACSQDIRRQVAEEETQALQPMVDELTELQSMKSRVHVVNEGLLQEVMLMQRCNNIKPMLNL